MCNPDTIRISALVTDSSARLVFQIVVNQNDNSPKSSDNEEGRILSMILPGATMEAELEDEIALVTGSSRGIGAATARKLAERGANVIVNFRSSEDAALSIAEDIRDEGSDALVIQADVTNPEAVEDMVDEVESTWGSVDILVNNANIPFARKPIADMEWEEFHTKIENELKAAFIVSKSVLPGMVEQEHGRLVYVSSGLSKSPSTGTAAHGTAKSGLNAFTKYVAEEYGEYGITANTVSPGLVETDATADRIDEEVRGYMAKTTPLGRIAQPEDVATTIVAFAGEPAQFVTGTYTPVNGGNTME